MIGVFFIGTAAIHNDDCVVSDVGGPQRLHGGEIHSLTAGSCGGE